MDYTILYPTALADHPFDRKVYALIQNEFWCQLADAEPVPYEERSPLL